jgi:hypothetical protein
MVSAPDFKTNSGGMSGTVCRATCSKMGAPYAALTGNSKWEQGGYLDTRSAVERLDHFLSQYRLLLQ